MEPPILFMALPGEDPSAVADLLEESGALLVRGSAGECAARALEWAETEGEEAPVAVATREAVALLRPRLPGFSWVSIPLSPFDLLSWLQHYNPPPRPLGVITLETDSADLPELQHWLGLEVEELVDYSPGTAGDWQPDWPELLRRCRRVAPAALAGGAMAARLAREAELPFYPVYPSRRSLLRALERAQEIQSLRRTTCTGSRLLEAVLENAEEGIVIVDPGGGIRGANRSAQEIGAAGPHLAGRELGRALPALLPALEALEQEGVCAPYLASMGKSEVLVKAAPLSSYLERPGSVITFQDIARISGLPGSRRRPRRSDGARYHLRDLVGESPALQALKERVSTFAQSRLNLLIGGETGTGKEMLAQAVHNHSPRQTQPFLAVNCAALSAALLESELFGYSQGAFTGARSQGKSGLFLAAHGGTLFLDEVSELPPQSQGRLLRALQEQAVRPLGGESVLPVDVRVIASSNRDLWQEVERGSFRRDLFFRLAGLHLVLPPLRRRREDIPALARHFLRKHAPAGRSFHLTPEAVEQLRIHPWPGNVRQMENVLLRAVLLAAPDTGTIGTDLLQEALGQYQEGCSAAGPASRGRCLLLSGGLREMETQAIRQILAAHGGALPEAARALDLEPARVRRAATPAPPMEGGGGE